MQRIQYYNDYNTQRSLEKTQKGLWIAFKLFWQGLIFSPLIASAIFITMSFLSLKEHGVMWAFCVGIIAVILYQCLFILKGILIGLKAKGNLFWIAFYLLAVAFACGLPAYLMYRIINQILTTATYNPDFSVWVAIVFGVLVYSRYQFHANTVSKFGRAAYQFGISLTCSRSYQSSFLSPAEPLNNLF